MGSKKSMLAYSVEEMTRLQGKVYRMLYSIREGLFDPNLTGAARIHQDNIDLMTDEPAGEVDDRFSESEPEESSSDESDVEALDRELHVELPIRFAGRTLFGKRGLTGQTWLSVLDILCQGSFMSNLLTSSCFVEGCILTTMLIVT